MKLSQVGQITDLIQYHNNLSPAVWDGWAIKPEVRKRLLDIAKLFVDNIGLDDVEVLDIRLTGSLANFNYTPQSDFDLHLVVDFDKLGCSDVAEAMFRAMKTIWNDNHDIQINGHEVEVYVEDKNNTCCSTGVVSLTKNKWIRTPEFVRPTYDRVSVSKKVRYYMDMINKMVSVEDNPRDIQRLIDKLRNMRRSGLEAGGEFSTQNLTYKSLRNLGYLDRLYKKLNDQIDSRYSL